MKSDSSLSMPPDRILEIITPQISAYHAREAMAYHRRSDGGILAEPMRNCDDWFLDTKRDNRWGVPVFVALFTLTAGGFFWVMGGAMAGLVIGALSLLCSLMVILSIVSQPDHKRQPVIRNGNWVWQGNRLTMTDLHRVVMMRIPEFSCAPDTKYHEHVTALIGITHDGTPSIMSIGTGAPLLRLLNQAGYAIERHD